MSGEKETWYVYDPDEGMKECQSQSDALLAARLAIETYRDRRLLEWHDGVDGILVVRKVFGMRDCSKIPEVADWRLECDCPP